MARPAASSAPELILEPVDRRYKVFCSPAFDLELRRLTVVGPNNTFYVWDLDDPPDAEAVVLGRPGPSFVPIGTFDSRAEWLATSNGLTTIEFWPEFSTQISAMPVA